MSDVTEERVMRLNVAFASCVCAAAFFAEVLPPAEAQTSITREAMVYPLMQRGELTGCQVAFSVLRSDQEYNDGRPTLVNGLILFELEGQVGLRIGVATDPTLSRFSPPDRAYFFGGYKSNIIDFADKFDSTDEGFRMFVFGLGDATADLLLKFLGTGTIDIMYAPAGGKVDARLTFDLASRGHAFSEYMDCMSTLFDKIE